jgi:hypothetical protein
LAQLGPVAVDGDADYVPEKMPVYMPLVFLLVDEDLTYSLMKQLAPVSVKEFPCQLIFL